MAKIADKKALWSAISLRRKYFIKSLDKTIKSPTCKNTHSLSTSLKRLLVLNDSVRLLYGSCLLPARVTRRISKFRKTLNAIRDNYEVMQKLTAMQSGNPFLAYVMDMLALNQKRLDKRIVARCRRLKKLGIPGYFKGKPLAKILQHKITGSVVKLLEDQLIQTQDMHEAAIVNADDRALHKMRVRYKSFRYSYELFAPLFVAVSEERLDYLRRVQTVLGDAHDWMVVRDIVTAVEEVPEYAGKAELLDIVTEKYRNSNNAAREYIMSEWPNILSLLP